MKKKKIAIILLFLSIHVISLSQKLQFSRLSNKDGLISNHVGSILKDSYGYMWFGTFNGLCRYDGYNYINFVNDPKNNNSINSNEVKCLFESRDKELFIGFTYEGFCIYNRETETFTRFRHDPHNANSLSHNYILTFYQDKAGNIWIGTRAGLDKFNAKTKSFTHYNSISNEEHWFSSISEDEAGDLWLYGIGNDIHKFNPRENKFSEIIFANNLNYSLHWGGSIKYDKRGNLWIGTESNGLIRYNPKSGKKCFYSTENQKLKSNIILKIIEDTEGTIWIGTDGGGAYRYNYQNDSLEIFIEDPETPTSISGNAVYDIYESEPGVIWIATYSGGVNVYNKYKNKFFKWSDAGKHGRRLNNKSITSLEETEDGKIWIGTDGGGLNLFDPKKQEFSYYTPENSLVPIDKVISMYIDKNRNIWLGSYAKGLCKVNFEKGTVKRFRGDVHSKGKTVLSDHIWDIAESSDKKLWLGLLSLGFNVYDPDKDTFTYYHFDSLDFSQGTLRASVVYKDKKGRMWVGTEHSGAGYFISANKSFVRFTHQKGNPLSICSNHIRDIFEDSYGNIWFATMQGGLAKLKDIEKGEFETFTINEGLPTNDIQKIVEDGHHNLWLATNKGISLFNKSNKKFINFDIDDGVQGDEFSRNAGLRAKSGYIYMGGGEGLNVFHPDSIRFNTTPPKVIITDFKIFNESIKPNKTYQGRTYLSKTISLSNEITLTFNDYIFSIEFAALDFASPYKNKFAYRLIGFNDNWTFVDAQKRFATYTNLNPGEYTFQVIACNNDGTWNKKGMLLKINILPPWWRTLWFKILYTLGFFLLFSGFYYFRIKAIHRRNIILKEEVKKRTLELEKSNKTMGKFFSIIAHDLKGPISALNSLVGLLQSEWNTLENDSRLEYVNHIGRSANQVKALVLNLLEWSRAQTHQIKTEMQMLSIRRLFEDTADVLSEQAIQKEITIVIELEEEYQVYGDYNMVSTIVRNILSNSIKYTNRKGKIVLSAKPEGKDYINLQIADNGVGMSEDRLAKLFSLDKGTSVKGTEKETGTGLGLVICHEFAEMNRGKIYAESKLGEGSKFYILLPAHLNDPINS